MARDVGSMSWGKLYEAYVNKAEKKGRTSEEVDQILTWLTGYKADLIHDKCSSDWTLQDFYQEIPKMNPYRELVTGKICGVQVETIEDPFMKFVRQLDKMIDELAKGKSMDKILRVPAGVESYIGVQAEDIQPVLNQVRDIFREVMPDATEKISFAMPTWWKNHNIIHFAAMKNHLGIYPGSEGVEHFAERLTAEGYKFSKGAIQFPYKKRIPYELIREIAIWSYENNSK